MHLCPMAFTEDTTALSTTQTLRHRQPVVNPVSKTKQIGAAIKSCHLLGGGGEGKTNIICKDALAS